MSYCNINNFLLAIIVILIITYTDNIFNNAPALKKLFTDSFNNMLLVFLVLLIILIDMPRCIILAFMVIYLSVYVNYTKKKVRFADVSTIYNNNSILSESEFIYNNTKPFPNGNLMPFQPPVIDTNINTSSINTNTIADTNGSDFITKVNTPSRDGFDINGCRYDFKNSPQNLTNYGSPLAQCETYSGEQAKFCGTVFYPLNA